MNHKVAAWRVLKLPEDEQGNAVALEGTLTLGSATYGRMRTRTIWWVSPGMRRYIAFSKTNSRTG